jgi:hypothetical protein
VTMGYVAQTTPDAPSWLNSSAGLMVPTPPGNQNKLVRTLSLLAMLTEKGVFQAPTGNLPNSPRSVASHD